MACTSNVAQSMCRSVVFWLRLAFIFVGRPIETAELSWDAYLCHVEDSLACAQHRLPDFDCLINPIATQILSFADTLVLALADLKFRGELRSSPASYLKGSGLVDETFEIQERGVGSSDEALQVECPFGFALLSVVRWGACLLASHPEAHEDIRCTNLQANLLASAFLSKPYGLEPREAVPVFLNTRFVLKLRAISRAMVPLIHMRLWKLDPEGWIVTGLDCEQTPQDEGPGAIDWNGYFQILAVGTPGRDDSIGAHSVAYNPDTFNVESYARRLTDCSFGFFSVHLQRINLVQRFTSNDYNILAQGIVEISHAIEESYSVYQGGTIPFGSFTLMAVTRWPVIDLIGMVATTAQDRKPDGRYGYQHKPYTLEFHTWEILRPNAEVTRIFELRDMSIPEHVAFLRMRRREQPSPCYSRLLSALEESLHVEREQRGAEKLVLYTMIWGSRLASYLPGVIQRMKAFRLERQYLVFCVGAACSICQAAHPFPALCVQGRLQTIMNKYTVMSAILNNGFDAVYLDLDTVLMKDPLPLILDLAQDYELLVSRDFAGECLNTGIIYAKAHPATNAFVARLVKWLWFHPYEFSQRAFSAMLGVERVLSIGMARMESERGIEDEPPRWTTLDATNRFVTRWSYGTSGVDAVEGWTGSLEEIIIFHFLDAEGSSHSDSRKGEYQNLFEVFFFNTNLDLADGHTPLWKQDPDVLEILLSSRHEEAPKKLFPCKSWLPTVPRDSTP
eukprot:TRINITY_DN33550_c0_g1_i1.p1 TRINITY_DN33550_c0_g1~~TRINITY_DN33550_c0_g1_i1.p1  ORF type:complete len:734 (-),score=97.40 TRINITY_DN33550_c0_g1_i1:59-2260(-)